MPQLSKHDQAWAIRRLPKSLITLLRENPGKYFVAGGFIRSIITGEKIQDIDVFAPTKDLARLGALAVAAGTGRPGPVEGRLFETDNAFSVKGTRPMVQFIHRWTFETPEAAIDSFDFTIAKSALWWDSEWKSVVHPDFYADLAAKRLVYVSPKREEEAGGSLLRVLKFYQRGYKIPLESLAAVIGRVVNAIDFDSVAQERYENGVALSKEQKLSFVLSGLLRQVDPNVDPDADDPLAGDESPKVAQETQAADLPF